jgi:hypothetical protein
MESLHSLILLGDTRLSSHYGSRGVSDRASGWMDSMIERTEGRMDMEMGRKDRTGVFLDWNRAKITHTQTP